eukprot:6850761-Heterocapsa_arctica.AAC.1
MSPRCSHAGSPSSASTPRSIVWTRRPACLTCPPSDSVATTLPAARSCSASCHSRSSWPKSSRTPQAPLWTSRRRSTTSRRCSR